MMLASIGFTALLTAFLQGFLGRGVCRGGGAHARIDQCEKVDSATTDRPGIEASRHQVS